MKQKQVLPTISKTEIQTDTMRLISDTVENKMKYLCRKDELMCISQLRHVSFYKNKCLDEQKEKLLCLGNPWMYYNIVTYTKMLPWYNYRN